MIKIFAYDRMNIVFCSTVYFNSQEVAEKKQIERKNALLKKFVKIDVKMNDFNIFAGIFIKHLFIYSRLKK